MVEAKARKAPSCARRRHSDSASQVENAGIEELLARPELHETFDVLSLRAVRVEARDAR